MSPSSHHVTALTLLSAASSVWNHSRRRVYDLFSAHRHSSGWKFSCCWHLFLGTFLAALCWQWLLSEPLRELVRATDLMKIKCFKTDSEIPIFCILNSGGIIRPSQMNKMAARQSLQGWVGSAAALSVAVYNYRSGGRFAYR